MSSLMKPVENCQFSSALSTAGRGGRAIRHQSAAVAPGIRAFKSDGGRMLDGGRPVGRAGTDLDWVQAQPSSLPPHPPHPNPPHLSATTHTTYPPTYPPSTTNTTPHTHLPPACGHAAGAHLCTRLGSWGAWRPARPARRAAGCRRARRWRTAATAGCRPTDPSAPPG